HHRLTRRGSASAAVVAESILLLVGVIGMARTEAVLDLLVIARALILVLDQEADRRTGGPALEHAREDAHRIALAPLGRVLRGPRTATVDILLQVRLGEHETRG